MSVEDLLNQIEDLLEEGKPSLMGSGKVKVDSEAIRNVVQEIHLNMPEEIIQARKIAAERKEILDNSQSAAAAKIKQAEIQAKRMVEEHEITKAAQANAADIIADARAQGADIIEKAKASAAELSANAQKWALDLRSGASNFVETIMSESEQILTESIENFNTSLNKVRVANQQLRNASVKKANKPQQ